MSQTISSPASRPTLDRAGGAAWLPQLGMLLVVAASLVALFDALPDVALRVWMQSQLPLWIPVSALVCWRWSWALLHWGRAFVYRYLVFPRLRRAAVAAVARRGPVPELIVLMATYRERLDVTERVVQSVLREFERLEGLSLPAVLVAVTGSDADDTAIRAAFHRAIDLLPGLQDAQLVLLRGENGKRAALAAGLSWILERGVDPDGVFVMMDGDTELEPGALAATLPLFRMTPKVFAVTTNEHARVQGPAWFSEWIHLRHGQRHLHNCSIALSNRLLCLTGRCSIFRGSCLDAAFVEMVGNDQVEHWLWGRYALLSGDDKSTWFFLLSRGRRMLYVPDVSVFTYEFVERAPLLRMYHNLRRWGGNMVRNSARAIAIGPRRLGLFCWWCLVDQRLSKWTLLVGPTALIYSLLLGRRELVVTYLFWLLMSRLFRSIPLWVHGRRISFFYAPMAIVSDWLGALVKLWVSFFPARQFWLNRGARELDTTRGQSGILERKMVAGLMLGSTALCFLLAVGELVGALWLRREMPFALAQVVDHPGLLWWLGPLVLIGAWLVFRIAPSGPGPAEEEVA